MTAPCATAKGPRPRRCYCCLPVSSSSSMMHAEVLMIHSRGKESVLTVCYVLGFFWHGEFGRCKLLVTDNCFCNANGVCNISRVIMTGGYACLVRLLALFSQLFLACLLRMWSSAALRVVWIFFLVVWGPRPRTCSCTT